MKHRAAKCLLPPWCGALLFAILFASAAAAAEEDLSLFAHRSWLAEDGLPQNSVQAVWQTSEGYLWVGTQSGLCRFDGFKFARMDPDITPRLTGSSVTALYESKEGVLHIGLEDHRVLKWQGGQFEVLDHRNGFPAATVRSIAETKDGTLWIGTNEGLVRRRGGKCEVLTTADGLAHNMVRALVMDSSGRLWIGTDEGLNYLENDSIRARPLEKGPARTSIRALCLGRNGDLWVGLQGGLIRLRQDQSELFTIRGGQSDNIISAIHEDQRGNLWVGTYTGLRRLVAGKLEVQLDGENKPHETVNAITEDQEGNIWLGTREGLHALTPRPFRSFSTDNGLTHQNVMSLCEDTQGRMWIGTWGGGLNCIEDGKVTSYNSTNQLGSDFVLGLHPDADGGLWIGTPYDRANLKYLKDGQFTRYGPEQSFSEKAARVLYRDRSNRLWLAVFNGLSVLENGVFTRFTFEDGVSLKTVYSICEDAQGVVWIGTPYGILLNEKGKFRRLPHDQAHIWGLAPDRDGSVWMTTERIGLIQAFKERSGPHYRAPEGMIDNVLYSVIEDNESFLWVTARNGISRVSKNALADYLAKVAPTIPNFSFRLSKRECSNRAQPSVWKARDGRLWFATSKGVVIVNPKEVRPNQTPPPVIIEEVKADKQSVWETGFRIHESSRGDEGKRESEPSHLPTSSPAHLLIPPGRSELEFHYTALSFTAPDKNRFKYKLEGFDRDWVEAESRRVAYYNNLRPGYYTFRVIASNNDGVWNSVGANVKLSLLPHFWQTWWFFGTCGLGAIGLVGGTARYVTRRKMQREMERLEQQHAVERERTRIAQDMHDDLGAKLSEILLATDLSGKKEPGIPELKSLIERTAGSVRELVDNLDAIVWAVNPRNDSVEKFALYICEYAEMYLKAASLRYTLNIPGELPECMLSSEVRHNLFLVLKEALHNIVKHAQALKVDISLHCESGTLTVIIDDDGKGFAIGRSSMFGNGLQNMEARMKNACGSFVLSSEPGKGTRIQLQVPLGKDVVL